MDPTNTGDDAVWMIGVGAWLADVIRAGADVNGGSVDSSRGTAGAVGHDREEADVDFAAGELHVGVGAGKGQDLA